jgi:hypothetical protein
MYNYYTALTSYENEVKLNDIENNITETLLANSDIERKSQSKCRTYIIYFLIFLLLTAVFGCLLEYFGIINFFQL